ncbi:MAG TPA: shikimate kinase [Marinagarivorans sp.]
MTRSNIVLIGMAGAGKSTVGQTLAEQLGYDFLDTDQLIESQREQTLQTILDETGYLGLRDAEEHSLLSIKAKHTVIATGGSAVYSVKAMHHLKRTAYVVYLEVSLGTVIDRIGDYSQRGLAKPAEQTLASVFEERCALYQQYADFSLAANDLSPAQAAQAIASKLGI